MKPRVWLIAAGILVLAAFFIGVVGDRRERAQNGAIRRAAEAARASAKAQGFRMEWGDLMIQPSAPEIALNKEMMTVLESALKAGRNLQDLGGFMEPALSGTAICRWKAESENWADVRGRLESCQRELDAVERVVTRPGARPLSLNLIDPLALALTWRMALALHDGDSTRAWSNLLAVTLIAVNLKQAPFGIDNEVQDRLVVQAFAATWEAFQTNSWSDEQCGRLESLWSGADFFHSLPDFAASDRVNALLTFSQKEEPQRTAMLDFREMGVSWSQFIAHPVNVCRDYWRKVTTRRELNWYWRTGIYLEAPAIIEQTCGYEQCLRDLAQKPTWLAMLAAMSEARKQIKHLPELGPHSLENCYARRLQEAEDFLVVDHVGHAEATRQVLLGAIRIHRQMLRRPFTPSSVDGESLPRDFINGRPLRLEFDRSGHFTLSGAAMVWRDKTRPTPGGSDGLVWPREATKEEKAAWMKRKVADPGPKH